MKKRFWLRKQDDAVSPVVATILLVAITVMLVGILYVWVNSMMATPKTQTPIANCAVFYDEDENYFMVKVSSMDGKPPSISDVRFSLHDAGDSLIKKGRLVDIYETTHTPEAGDLAYVDSEADTRLNQNDYFIINRTGPYGGSLDEGSLSLIYTNTEKPIVTVTLHSY